MIEKLIIIFRNIRFLPILMLITATAITLLLSAENTSKEENEMEQKQKYSAEEFHRKFAIDFNNYVWGLLGKEERTKAEDDMMVHAAHASRIHWQVIGTPLNAQRGEWLISRVYSVLNRPESALYHARNCLTLTEEHSFKDFDLAYAYEAMARAYAALGNEEECRKYLDLTIEAGEKISAKEDRELFFSDFDTEPWYGMRKP